MGDGFGGDGAPAGQDWTPFAALPENVPGTAAEIAGADGDPVGVDAALAYETRNDLGNTNRFLHRFGGALMWVRDRCWAAWDGRRWNLDQGDRQAHLWTHETVRCIAREAGHVAPERRDGEEDDKYERRVAAAREAGLKFARSSGNSGKIAAILSEARPYRETKVEDLDRDPWRVALANGTLVLRPPDGEPPEAAPAWRLEPHDPADRISKLMDVAYDPEAARPEFDAFMQWMQPDPKMRGMLQRHAGYCLTGDTSEQALLFFLGEGDNGKSTYLNLLHRIFGDYAVEIPFQALLFNDRRTGGEATPELVDLPGARMVSASEPEKGARFSEAMLKTLTGETRMSVRALHKGTTKFTPRFKLLLGGNHKPNIQGQDKGIWRRVRLLPFDAEVTDEMKAEAARRGGIDAILSRELPGVLNWLLDGYALWREGGLTIPDVVRAATDEYRSESDDLGAWIVDELVPEAGAKTQSQAVYETYKKWCERNGSRALKQTKFSIELAARGYAKVKGSGGKMYWLDVRLAPDGEPHESPAF